MTTWHFLKDNPENAAYYASSLIKSSKTSEDSENYWFPTPEEPGDPQTHTPIQQRILRELRSLQDLEKLNPQDDPEFRKQFLANFDWTDSTLNPVEIAQIEELLVEFHDIFARHRFDIGMNEDFKVTLTPKDDSPAYSQSLPTPINIKEDILVELALLHRYGIITTLPFSKYASPIFAQKKPNGKLRLLVDLRKINNLISDDYINNNHPVNTITDAAQHMAGKRLFCKLDCSQAYHCLQMADQRSIEMLAFNFDSRTFAYRRLAQGLSRALSAFASFMREYLDKVIKADQCAQYVDDIGIAANSATQLINNLRATFECIRTAGLKLAMHKCHFGAKEIDFLGRTITPEGVRPQRPRVQNFLEKTIFPKSKKALQRYLGFLNYYHNYIPRLSEKLTPFFKLLKNDAKVMVTPELLEQFTEINKALDRCCELALKQPLPNKQIALMTDASFSAAGYAVLIEDDPMEKYSSTRKAFAPVAYGSKTFSPAQLKMSIYAKEFLAIFFAFKEFGHIFWGTPTPVILDHRLGLNPNPKIIPTTDFAEELQRHTQILIDKTKKNIMQTYLKYKDYYDRKAKAAPLEQGDFCFILQPLADHQGSKIPFREFRWIGPYVIEKILPNENYIVRKLNSNKTQILHRIRLRKYTPNTTLQDTRPEGNLQADDEIIIPQDDLYIISWESNIDDFPPSTEQQIIPNDSPTNFDEQDAIITDLDLRTTIVL